MADNHYDLNPTEFKQYFRDFFVSIARLMRFFLAIARKNFIWLIIVAGLSFGAAFFWLKHRANKYEYRMSCVYNDNQGRTFGEMIGQLDLLLQNKELQMAANELNLPVEKVKKISSIKAKTMTLGLLENDYSNNKNPFFIDVTLSDPAIVNEVEAQVLTYLNHNEMSLRSVDKQMTKWKSRDEFYSKQLLKLDSLKDVIRLSYINGTNEVDLAQKSNSVVDIYKLSDSMSFYLADIKYYIDHYQSVQKIYGFKLISVRSQSSLLKKSAILSVIALLGVLVLLALNAFIKKYPTS